MFSFTACSSSSESVNIITTSLRMFQMVQYLFPSGLDRSSKTSVSPPSRTDWTHSSHDFLTHVRQLSGLRKDDVFYNLRIPNQFESVGEEINLVLITGHGVFCIDLKTWSGSVSAQSETHWNLQVMAKEQNFTNILVEQVPNALQAITVKTQNLCSHLKRCGLNIHLNLLFPRILFLSPDCVLSEELSRRMELVTYSDVEPFLSSLREGYMSWLSDALTPSWISGHLSFRQIRATRERLQLMRTWDLLQLSSGQELKGDYQGCQHLAFNRQETEVLEFTKDRALLTDTLWSLLGQTSQVTVRMYKRGAEGWLGKPLIATATIPSTTRVTFRISGEETDAQFPAKNINCITLSI